MKGPATMDERRAALRAIFVGKTRCIPEDDPNGLPTAYGEVERHYMNLMDDDIGTRDVLGANR